MLGWDAHTPDAGPAASRRPATSEPPPLTAPVPTAVSETLHRLANNLAILSATMRLERRRVSDPAARAVLDGAVARLDAMAQVHRLIYGLPPEARIDLTGFLGHLAPVIGTSLGMGCGVRGVPVEVSGRTAEGLAVAMTELALNAYKHGYGGAPGAGVEVRVAKAPGGWVRLTVRDWGQGLNGGPDGGLAEAARPFGADDGAGSDEARPNGEAPREGLGLRLVGSAIESLGGRMRTVTDGGVHVVIEVPRA